MAVALAILGVVGGFAGPAIKVAKSIVAPVGRQFSYLCCFRSNIKTLKDEAKTLEDETSGLQAKVDAARNNARLIFPQVGTWLSNSEEMQKGINGILREALDMETGCLKLRERYSLSRKAKKTANAIKELVEKCKFNDDTISYPPAPAASAPFESATKANEFESRREVEEKIMKSLKDKKVYKIGIAGMGGLGKTTMARKIMDRARGEGLFEEAVMAVVSQPVDKLNIQLQIGEQLGLTFKVNTLIPRAHILRERLRGNKRTLLVLDDVWEKNLDMEELGIPCEDGCKILLTSRDKGVFKAMDVKEVRELKILDEGEAWIMFSDKAGIRVDGDALLNIARDVMKECKGLPLALAIVGKTLKGVTNISIWKDALNQLQKNNPSDIENVIPLVYNPLKLSYDRLDSENAKSMLLLCCLFAEDYNIPLEYLTYFAMGLHWFEKDWDLEEVRGRICTLIDNLKSRCLLLDGSDKDHVRMHDIVRDVSIFIASKELKQVKCRSSCTACTGRCTCSCTCTWISSHVDGGARHVPPQQSCFPKLKLLLMNDKVDDEMANLIGGSAELVLLIENYNLMKSLPALKMSLTTLVLLSCDSLESIAVVGQLESLEILICHYCDSIKELPEQVRGLKRLKRLEISVCENLNRIAAGVISSMVALEELKIVDSFNDWKGGEIDEEQNDEASWREIESLKKLRCLNIDVSDIALAAQPLRLSFDKLVQFTVRFGKSEEYVYGKSYQQSCQRRMYLHSRDESDIIDFGDLSANILLTRAECILARAEHNQDFNLNLATVQNIRWLNLQCFTNKKNITSAAVAAASFPLLEYLCLNELRNLEEIWDDAPIPSNSFNNLKGLRLDDLRALKRMGKCVLSTASDLFLQLESIEINFCKEMEHLLVLVPNEEEQDKEDHSTVLIFPKLKKVLLRRLPKLTNLICSRGIESIQFPLLAEMEIGGCENLKWLVSRDDDGDHYKDDSLHLFCNPKVSFPSLQRLSLADNRESKNVWCDKVPMGFFRGLVELEIKYYDKMRRLFSSSSKIPQNLVNLQTLRIINCKEMVKVIEDLPELRQLGKSPHHNHSSVELFSNLSTLYVGWCPNLGNLFSSATTTRDCGKMEHVVLLQNEEEGKGNDITIFPKLKSLHLYDLHNLTSICKGIQSIEFPLLADLTISNCKNMRCLVSSSDDEKNSEEHYGDHDSSHLFCQPKVSFPSLRSLSLADNRESKNVWCDKVPMGFFRGLVELWIHSYGKMRRLFSSSSKIPQNLVNLQTLEIWGCNEMVKVIEDDEEVSSSSSLSSSCDHPTNPTTTPLFPSLQEIRLTFLPKLESFCEWRRCAHLQLPSLKKLEIAGCHEMKSFNAGAGSLIITPALQTVEIDYEELESVDDLNAALLQHFEKAKEQREAREAAYRNRMAEEEEEEEEEGSREGHERNGEIDDSSTISTEDE